MGSSLDYDAIFDDKHLICLANRTETIIVFLRLDGTHTRILWPEPHKQNKYGRACH